METPQLRKSVTVLLLATLLFVGCQSAVDRAPTSSMLGSEPSLPLAADSTGPSSTGPSSTGSRSPQTVSQVYSAADMDLIPVGAQCEVQLKTADRKLQGRVQRVENGMLTLVDAVEFTRESSQAGHPIVAKTPYIKRIFKNVDAVYSSRPVGQATVNGFEIDRITAQLRL